jgi:dTDP-4-dehydrorhamnose reductase
MSTLIFGGGFLGHRFAALLRDASLSTADITDAVAVRAEIAKHRPRAIVNCAGKTGVPNVDWCESHPFVTYRANVVGPLVLAAEAAAADVYLLHLGSGCVFYGPSPTPGGWRETDHANPSAVYSRTKYAADLVLSTLPNVGIARLRMPIDDRPGPRNLITKLSGYAQVVDVQNSVTVIPDLARVVEGLIERRATGVFHATNPGVMRHSDLLELFVRLVDPAHRYDLIREEELVARGLAARPRSNCVLASPRLDALGLTMPPIDVSLRNAMETYARQVRRTSVPMH